MTQPPSTFAILAFAGVMFLVGVILSGAFYLLLKSINDLQTSAGKNKKARPVPSNMIELLEHALAMNAGGVEESLVAQLHINEAQRALEAMSDSQAEVLAALQYIRNAKHEGINVAAYYDRMRQREEYEKAATKPFNPNAAKY